MEQNLWRAMLKWGRLVKLWGREGVDRITAGIFCVDTVQAVLLFGYETWVITLRLEKALEGFNHRAVWQMVGMVPKLQREGTWVYPPIGEELATVGLD